MRFGGLHDNPELGQFSGEWNLAAFSRVSTLRKLRRLTSCRPAGRGGGPSAGRKMFD
jgi:hypothetical protein